MLRRLSFVLPVAAILVAVVVLFLPQGWKTQLRRVFLDAVGPVIRVYDRAHGFYGDVRGGFKSLDEAQREARLLREQNAQLQTENNVLRNFQEENQRLREMLGFKQDSRYKLLACRVVSRDPSNWWNTVVINRGWTDNDKLTSDLPVVTPRGVVGKTGLVSRNVTEVILMINQNCRIAGSLEGSRDQGIVVGMGAPAEGSPRVKMIYLPRNAQVPEGTRVFTSGLGDVFPPGLFLGTVLPQQEADTAPSVPAAGGKSGALSTSASFGLYREVVIDPALDLTQLDELFVVLPN